jgi:hypothetical protein
MKNHPEWLTVREPRAVSYLLDPVLRAMLSLFMNEPRSIKAVAEELEQPLNAVHHRVKQLEQARLLQIAKLEPRAGRSIKHYQAVAEGFFVPFTATTDDGIAGFVRQQLLPWTNQIYDLMVRASQALIDDIEAVGFRVYKNGGTISNDFSIEGQRADLLELMLRPESPALIARFETLRLSRARAKQLQREMHDLLEKYADQDGSEAYTVHVALTPGSIQF